ncbi:MAG: hypothetical protein HQK55_09885 [Deltaproteobacteria bacterium]|nr:hypothetical protein [Deltaproteobacteria bacterium]
MPGLKTVILLLMVAVLLVMPRSLWADTTFLSGKIGEFPISVSLERNEEKLSGWYFYHSKAKEIRLDGSLDRQGAFRLEETAGDKKTGIFEGSVKEGRWTGTWRKTTGAAPLAFYLEENRNRLKNLKDNYNCTAKERDAKYHYTYIRKLKLAVADGVVKEFEAVQGAYGDDQDEQTCSIDLKDLKQVTSDVGILLQAKDDNAGNENKKCAIRIVGDPDILWIRFGDSSEEGNDCRGVDSVMFCSPRDIILDRRTRKCQVLK